MKNNNTAKATPLKTNVCGNDTAATGKAAIKANKDCKEKIDSALEELKPPGAEAA
jgi:hypothetical protein